jgi:type IV pilus assembly protein PilM
MGLKEYFGTRGRNLVGVDIGSSSVKVALVTSQGANQQSLELWGNRDLPSGTIVNGSIQREPVVVQAIEKLLPARKIRGSKTATALPSQSVILKRLLLPRLPEDELEDSLSWEIAQHFPVDLNEVDFDYSVLAEASDRKPSEFLLAAARREKIAEFSRVISLAGLKPVVVDVAALALHHLYLHNFGPNGTTIEAILDIGATTTNVTILRGESLILNRVLSIGGHQYRQSIQNRLGLSADEAERYLQLREMPAALLSRIRPILDVVSEDLAGEIEKTISYFQTTLHVPKIVALHICGGGSLILGLRETLSRTLNLPVNLLNPLRNLDSKHVSSRTEKLEHHSARSALAIGLALRMARET